MLPTETTEQQVYIYTVWNFKSKRSYFPFMILHIDARTSFRQNTTKFLPLQLPDAPLYEHVYLTRIYTSKNFSIEPTTFLGFLQ